MHDIPQNLPISDDARYRIATNCYGRYCVPSDLIKRPAAWAVLRGNVHEPDTLDFMRTHAGTGDIVHAGTFFGDFLPALSGTMARNAKIWAFEPGPENHKAAEQTVAINALRNVTLTNAALSDRAGRLFFKTHDATGNPIGGVSRIVPQDGPGVQKVNALMLDYTVPQDRDVSILQLDVEGHEKEALLGAIHTIGRCAPILILEYMDDFRWLRRHFGRFGYKPAGKVHGNFVYATPKRIEQIAAANRG
ncbi:FkbM family methyltransferase [Aliishimia ponticola]|uniref:FkbM family methyltransferase n=1 Tax=Aliishimia ponticola TaxID=2499833 RepID=A0A4S4N677_9RHOB|nr:FkbM family methyltransferase [Aliishimia ponticola]THH34622.1 FkbM family methyltransferase [Aliishimia ponticola]